MNKFIIMIVLVIVVLSSCSKNPNEPIIEDEDPYELKIVLIEDDLIELSWKNISEDNNVVISRKYGQLDWDYDYLTVDNSTTSITEIIPTSSQYIVSYYLREISGDYTVGISDTLAWISSNVYPTDFVAEQISQDSLMLSWHDNSYGEMIYNIDKKFGENDWQLDYLQIEADQNNGYNTILSCFDSVEGVEDSVFYRIKIVNGSSSSSAVEVSICTQLQSPENLSILIENESLILSWINNYQMDLNTIIERKYHGGDYQIVKEFTSYETSWLDSDIEPSEIYYYKVKFQLDDNYSNSSNIAIGNIQHTEFWVPLDFPTIHSAVDAIDDNGEILILPGIYYENLQIADKTLTISSLHSFFPDDGYIEQTIINGNNSGTVISLSNCNHQTSLISGITLQGGSGTFLNTGVNSNWYYGGGILLNNSHAQISNAILKENNAQLGGGLACLSNSNCEIINTEIDSNSSSVDLNYGGGGIFCDESILAIENSSVCNNFSSSDGGGMLIVHSTANISNTVIKSNTSYRMGGGIKMELSSDVNLTNLILEDNYALWKGGGISNHSVPADLRNLYIYNNVAGQGGGGVYLSSGHVSVFENIIIAGNESDFGAGIFLNSAYLTYTNVTVFDNTASSGGGALYAMHEAYPTIINSIFWNNSPQEIMIRPGNMPSVEGTVTIYFSNIDGGISEVSATNPSNVHWLEGNIVLNPLFYDAYSHDFQLQFDSPCIDAGNPDPIYNDYDGTRNDMGVYGGPNAEL